MTYSDAPTAYRPQTSTPPIDAAIKNTFDHFDTNRSGRLDYRELRNCLNALGIDVTGREAADVIARCAAAALPPPPAAD